MTGRALSPAVRNDNQYNFILFRMRRSEEEIRKSDAERLLLKAKEMELNAEKIPVRMDKNTVLLVSANKLQKKEAMQNLQEAWAKKKANGKRKL